MENLNVVNDTRQAVVEPAADSPEKNGGGGEGTPSSAAKTGITPRTQTAAENARFRKLRLENESFRREIEALKSKLSGTGDAVNYRRQRDICLQKLAESRMAADLEAVKAIDPSVNDLGEIGGDFIRLIENGIDAKTAFLAVKTASDGKHSPLPPETGSIGVTESAQSEFFTSKELDRLTSRDLENPLIFKKALKSLKKL